MGIGTVFILQKMGYVGIMQFSLLLQNYVIPHPTTTKIKISDPAPSKIFSEILILPLPPLPQAGWGCTLKAQLKLSPLIQNRVQ